MANSWEKEIRVKQMIVLKSIGREYDTFSSGGVCRNS